MLRPLFLHLLLLASFGMANAQHMLEVTLANGEAAISWSRSVCPQDAVLHILERSEDGRAFHAICLRDPNLADAYTVRDQEPAQPPVAHYRLRWISDNGTEGVTEAVVFERSTTKPMLRMAPNPAKGQTVVQAPPQSHVRIVSMQGQEMGRWHVAADGQLEISTADWAVGCYTVSVATGADQQHARLVKW
jgi:hypothetical protein